MNVTKIIITTDARFFIKNALNSISSGATPNLTALRQTF